MFIMMKVYSHLMNQYLYVELYLMKREYFFTHVDTNRKTNCSMLGNYTKHQEDMTNEEKTLPLMQEVGLS